VGYHEIRHAGGWDQDALELSYLPLRSVMASLASGDWDHEVGKQSTNFWEDCMHIEVSRDLVLHLFRFITCVPAMQLRSPTLTRISKRLVA
jgi:hypothetical protein